MLGGLARWLRAAGYDAAWQAGIDDWDLVRLAQREKRILLSCDTGIFRIGIIRDGDLPALLVPQKLLTKQKQLAFVLGRLNLEPLRPRCMACGGALNEIPKEQVAGRAPPRTFATVDRFFECSRCQRLFWEGTHWQQIAAVIEQARKEKERHV
jgi:uncharacterized protein with PIN domain